jgi:putative component of toxin-antitoxin plasmid stabilization module
LDGAEWLTYPKVVVKDTYAKNRCTTMLLKTSMTRVGDHESCGG